MISIMHKHHFIIMEATMLQVATLETALALFNPLDFIKFINRNNCVVQFESIDSVDKALELHNTKQLRLNAPLLSVTSQEVKPTKRVHLSSNSYVILDPPRFNNYLIPVLPSFLNH